ELAATALAIGSPSYVAPEQARGMPSGPAADVWALGATMYFAVEGAPPFDKGTLVRTLAAVVDEDPRPMLRAGPWTAPLTALLAKDPQDRLSASKIRIWLRWLVDVAHWAPSSEVLVEAPASDPGRAPTGGPSAETAPAPPREGPTWGHIRRAGPAPAANASRPPAGPTGVSPGRSATPRYGCPPARRRDADRLADRRLPVRAHWRPGRPGHAQGEG